MPGFDGTGPAGMGPMTGGGRGWCVPSGPRPAGYGRYGVTYPVPASPPYAYGLGRPRWGAGRRFWGRAPGWGRGRGLGRGSARGRGWW
jgi:hypothetical protein